MRYNWFEIRNFRGIKAARIDLAPRGAGIFTLIGLNESGKTTILEAISSFRSHGGDEKSLYQSAEVVDDPSSFVPKHEKYNFTGDVCVTAEVEFESNNKNFCIEHAEKESDWKIDSNSVPDRFSITRGYKFLNSDKDGLINRWDMQLRGKKGRSSKILDIPIMDKAAVRFRSMVNTLCPEIVYFPTFIFDQPEKIVLNPQLGEKTVDKLYRNLISNVGTSLSTKVDIKTHIVDRILNQETTADQFLGLFGLSQNKQQQIDSVVNELSHAITDTVFDSWSRIFGKAFKDREVRLKLGVDSFDDGSPRVYIQIGLKDGRQQYDISERSLGFRWFFSFLLFTLYRSTTTSFRGTFFLLDEPASNLHSSAQTLLMESFPRITAEKNILMYSTHSHYLINPEWLDQAFIVSNLAMDYDDLSEDSSQRAAHTEIVAEKYRRFVGQNPDKTTYFQPVLDRLQVIPSKLDSLKPSVLVEGKGDFLALSYGLFLCDLDTSEYAILPTRGADHYHEIVGIMLGWGVNFCLCFDADAKGKRAAKEYGSDWGIESSKVCTLADIDPILDGKAIEAIVSESDLKMIATHYGTTKVPSKSQIQLFFSEKLALRERVSMSADFVERIRGFDARVRSALGCPPAKNPKTAKGKKSK